MLSVVPPESCPVGRLGGAPDVARTPARRRCSGQVTSNAVPGSQRSRVCRRVAVVLSVVLAVACKSSPSQRPIDVDVTPVSTAWLDDRVVQSIVRRSEVVRVAPRLTLDVAARASGNLDGFEVGFEVGDFADGIDPELISGAAPFSSPFVDWDTGQTARPSCADCSPEVSYCDEVDHTCHHRVPALVSPTTVTLYNDEFAAKHGLPRIANPDQRIGGGSLRFTIVLGESMVAGTTGRSIHHVEAVVVGVSPHAAPIGLTFPSGYVRRWNQEFHGRTRYSSVIVTLRDAGQLPAFSRWSQALGLHAQLAR